MPLLPVTYVQRSIVLLLLMGGFLPGWSLAEFREVQDPLRPELLSQFTKDSVVIDGQVDRVWSTAKKYPIAVAMSGDLSPSASDCTTNGTVQSLWDGASLYLLIEVKDANVMEDGDKATDKDGVEIYFDLWNDKFPKNEEDDGLIRVNSTGELTGAGIYDDRLKKFAVKRLDKQTEKVGYTVELGIHLGGLPKRNGTAIGMDFAINDALPSTQKVAYRIFWSDGKNKGLNDNSRWGNLVLDGYDGKLPLALDTYVLRANLKKAQALTRGIWLEEAGLDKTVVSAKQALRSTSQATIDAANNDLDQTMKALRRKGKYPDPHDLTAVNHLPDPFTFLDGSKVKGLADWSARREQIKDLAQYYEYGYMPGAPQQVTAEVNGTTMLVTVSDKEKTSSFNAILTVPTVEQCGKAGPYPVIVSMDFRAAEAKPLYLQAGYAVLSVVYTTIASDNFDHTGAFYSLYPYDVATGHDAGTLLAWAWGASRAVDGITYLSKNNATYKNLFDLSKLVVTGFSRCGKAALAAGLMDERFGVVNPGASGCGGAASYRYDSFGNVPYRNPPFGNVYAWGTTPGAEVCLTNLDIKDTILTRCLRVF